MSTLELLHVADGLVALKHLGEDVCDRHVLDTVNQLLLVSHERRALRRVVKILRTFDLAIARV